MCDYLSASDRINLEAYFARLRDQPNLSDFAFTATPKYKTKKVLNEPGPSGEAPFHRYTMRQAIEEKFILDVLKHSITYEAYYHLIQVGDDDPHVERKNAARALARALTFHAANRVPHLRISSLGELAGWGLPALFPLCNNVTKKSLFP